jgi:hypothetical protein
MVALGRLEIHINCNIIPGLAASTGFKNSHESFSVTNLADVSSLMPLL